MLYILLQVLHLERLSSEGVLSNGLLPFLPFDADTVPKSTIEHLSSLNVHDYQW